MSTGGNHGSTADTLAGPVRAPGRHARPGQLPRYFSDATSVASAAAALRRRELGHRVGRHTKKRGPAPEARPRQTSTPNKEGLTPS